MKRVLLALQWSEALRAALELRQQTLPLPAQVDPERQHLTLVLSGNTPLPILEAVNEA